MRERIYDDMVADPQVFKDNQWPHAVGLLRVAREAFWPDRFGYHVLPA